MLKQDSSTTQRWQILFIIVSLVAATTAVYWNVHEFYFVNYDDNMYVFANPMTLSGLSWASVQWAFTSLEVCNWHPLTWLSYMLDVELFGLHSGAFHIVSLVFHILNTILLFLFLWKSTGEQWKSALIAALFALHPMHVESVAWISERKDVLSMLFILLSLHTYRVYVARNSNIVAYLASLVFFLFALMAKPIAVIMPVLLIAVDIWPMRREALSDNPMKGLLRLLPEKIPFILLSCLGAVIAIIAQQQGDAVTSINTFGVLERIMHAGITYVEYAFMLLIPRNLGFYYLYKTTPDGLAFVLALTGLLCVSVLAFILVKKHPYLASGWIIYVVALLPVIGIIQVGGQSMADRYTYIPLVGLSIMAVWGVGRLVASHKAARIASVALAFGALAVYGVLAHKQVQVWQSNQTLYENTLQHDPLHPIINNNYGTHFFQAEQIDSALIFFRRSAAASSNYALPFYNAGLCFQLKGQDDSAVVYYKQSLKHDPMYIDAYMNVGVALLGLDRYIEAEKFLKEAVVLTPTSYKVHYHLGRLYRAMGRPQEAEGHWRQAIALENSEINPYLEYGLFLYEEGRYSEAEGHLLQARSLGSEDSTLVQTLVQIASYKHVAPTNAASGRP